MARVILSKFVQWDLDEIAEYYISLSKDYVKKTIDGINDQIDSLKQFPKSGRIVPELEKHGIMKYRQLIEGYYRIIYEVQTKDNHEIVFVHTIIDGRMNFEDVLVKRLMREQK